MARKRVILIKLSFSEEEFAASPYVHLVSFPSLGLLYLAAVLKKGGFDPVYLDSSFDDVSPSRVASDAARSGVLFVGIHSNISFRSDVCGLIRGIKTLCSVPVIVGGPAHFLAPDYFAAGADAVVSGEAEPVVCEIASRLASGAGLDGVPGVTVRADPPRPPAPPPVPPQDLDSLPQPAWELAPPARYRNDLGLQARHPFASVLGSRGCPQACAFCCRLYRGRETHYRLRSPRNLIDEIVNLRDRHGVRHVKFEDEDFGARPGWREEFCTAMAAERPPVTWHCFQNPMYYRDNAEDLLRLMRRAGCTCLHFGLQSATPSILEAVGRNPEEPEIIRRITPIMNRLGYLTVIDFIYGLPGETEETLDRNLRFALETGVHFIQIHPLKVVPHTDLHDRYGDGPVSGLEPEQIQRAVDRANRVFFLRARTAMEVGRYVLLRNPGFLKTMLRVVPFGIKLSLGGYKTAAPDRRAKSTGAAT